MVAINPLKREVLNKQLNLKTTQSKLIKIEQLRILSETLNHHPEALDAFIILMHERHRRAEVNSRQALEISHRDSMISKLQKTILDFNNSEILKFGQFIKDSLQRRGEDRKNQLIQHDLVHKDDYNDLAEEAAHALDDIADKASRQDEILAFIRQELGVFRYNQIMTRYRNQSSN